MMRAAGKSIREVPLGSAQRKRYDNEIAWSATIRAFIAQCEWTYEAWSTHRALFDDNSRPQSEVATRVVNALGRISRMTQEYVLLQISKLHDPATQGAHVNLSIAYLIEHGDWEDSRLVRLKDCQARLGELADQLRGARNKLLSHLDLGAALAGEPLGAFEADEDTEYFAVLQELALLLQDGELSSPLSFDSSALSDARALAAHLNLARAQLTPVAADAATDVS